MRDVAIDVGVQRHATVNIQMKFTSISLIGRGCLFNSIDKTNLVNAMREDFLVHIKQFLSELPTTIVLGIMNLTTDNGTSSKNGNS